VIKVMNLMLEGNCYISDTTSNFNKPEHGGNRVWKYYNLGPLVSDVDL
jgi:hypothetical protein